MSQAVELSDELVQDASRTAGSAAQQIELWAQLGRAIEPLLSAHNAQALRRAGATRSIAECLADVDTEAGRQRVADYLKSQPFPHYEAVPGEKDVLIRIEADGTRTRGRFVGREFQTVS